MKAFLSATQKKAEDIQGAWRGPVGNYTKVMWRTLPIIAKDLNLSVYDKDYYTLDAVFYTEIDTQHFPVDSVYVKSIEIAYEHENQVNGSVNEIHKLQHFNAPLKVLVTYAPKNKQFEYLDKYCAIINNADIFGDITYSRQQLVIFGELISNQPTWSFWKYYRNSFNQIESI